MGEGQFILLGPPGGSRCASAPSGPRQAPHLPGRSLGPHSLGCEAQQVLKYLSSGSWEMLVAYSFEFAQGAADMFSLHSMTPL